MILNSVAKAKRLWLTTKKEEVKERKKSKALSKINAYSKEMNNKGNKGS